MCSEPAYTAQLQQPWCVGRECMGQVTGRNPFPCRGRAGRVMWELGLHNAAGISLLVCIWSASLHPPTSYRPPFPSQCCAASPHRARFPPSPRTQSLDECYARLQQLRGAAVAIPSGALPRTPYLTSFPTPHDTLFPPPPTTHRACTNATRVCSS